jgi:hypothetical protein
MSGATVGERKIQYRRAYVRYGDTIKIDNRGFWLVPETVRAVVGGKVRKTVAPKAATASDATFARAILLQVRSPEGTTMDGLPVQWNENLLFILSDEGSMFGGDDANCGNVFFQGTALDNQQAQWTIVPVTRVDDTFVTYSAVDSFKLINVGTKKPLCYTSGNKGKSCKSSVGPTLEYTSYNTIRACGPPVYQQFSFALPKKDDPRNRVPICEICRGDSCQARTGTTTSKYICKKNDVLSLPRVSIENDVTVCRCDAPFTECTKDDQCPAGQTCYAGECTPSCSETKKCPGDKTCVQSQCVEKCRQNKDCRKGLQCVGGKCVESPHSSSDVIVAGIFIVVVTLIVIGIIYYFLIRKKDTQQ